MVFEHFGRARPLQREQRLLLHMVDDDFAGQPPLHVGDVAMLGRAVDDDVEIVAAARRHQIVDDPAVVVEQQRIFGLHVGGGLEVARHQLLKRRIGAAAMHQQLAHVADVEQARIFARPQMLGDDALILDRHFVAGERHHPRRRARDATHRAEAFRAAEARSGPPFGSPLYGVPRAWVSSVGPLWTSLLIRMRSGKGCDGQGSPRASAAAPVCP